VIPIYPALAIAAAAGVVVLERAVLRSGIFRQPAYWVAMAIVYMFMVPVDGWLTKLSAPIVVYREGDTSGLRPVWDILAEEFLYAFALLTLVILVWDRAGRGEDDGEVERWADRDGRHGARSVEREVTS
jgi:lycopene cyclase domain-containing protein